jgi:DNA-binding FadR family transcriptional regulator
VTTTFERVRDALGTAICDGSLAQGTLVTVEELETTLGASRSIVREAARVLASMGLLVARQRVGLRVLPADRWDGFDPLVIRWRLNSSARPVQLRDLADVRIAVEPEAARLAAVRRSAPEAALIVAAAERLAASANSSSEEFLAGDTELHRLVLAASGNALFVRFGTIIEEALRDRALVERDRLQPDTLDLQLHGDLARHINARDAAQAAHAMHRIIERAHPLEQ